MNKVKDSEDTPIYAAIALAKPDHAITGDKTLRLTLKKASEIISNTKICTSKEFLGEFKNRKIM
jgi:predicted nucleic acid-binding protein